MRLTLPRLLLLPPPPPPSSSSSSLFFLLPPSSTSPPKPPLRKVWRGVSQRQRNTCSCGPPTVTTWGEELTRPTTWTRPAWWSSARHSREPETTWTPVRCPHAVTCCISGTNDKSECTLMGYSLQKKLMHHLKLTWRLWCEQYSFRWFLIPNRIFYINYHQIPSNGIWW